MKKSRLSWYKQTNFIELFVACSTARTAASLVGVNKKNSKQEKFIPVARYNIYTYFT